MSRLSYKSPMRVLHRLWPLSAIFLISPLAVAQIAPQIVPLTRLSAAEVTLERESFIPEGVAVSAEPFAAGGRGVIGEDDRSLVDVRAYPWTAVGRILGVNQNGSEYTCTGTLIAENIVLTNAHCVVSPDTQELARVLYFDPNLIDGQLASPLDRATATAVIFGTDFSDSNEPPHPDDWALVALNKPLGKKFGTIAPLGLETDTLLAEPYEQKLLMVGYSGDYPEENPGATASAHWDCSITDEVDEVIYHECDTYGGSSGGPILAEADEGEYRIVAVNSAERTTREGDGVVNYAVKMPRLLAQVEQRLASAEE